MSDGLATMADILSVERIPLQERDLPASTYEALRRGAKIDKDKPALQFFLEGPEYNDTIYYTFGDLLELVNQTANMLHGLGIGKDDVVSTILPNTPQSYFTLFGGQAVGIVNPIDPFLEAGVMADLMNAAGTKVLVTLAPFFGVDTWSKVASIADQVSTLETILRVNLANYLPTFKRYIVRAATLTSDRGSQVGAQVLDFVSAARRYSGEKLDFERQIQPGDTAAYFHTSGASGPPKLVKTTHGNEVFAAWATAMNITLTPDKVLMSGLPLFHVNGAVAGGLAPWMFGASIILATPQGFRSIIPHFWEIVEYYKVNGFAAVPELFPSLLEIATDDRDISSLEFVLSGGGPLTEEEFHGLSERTGARILEAYTLTEGAGISALNPYDGEKKISSAGLRLPYQEMKVVQLDAAGNYQRDCEIDEIGAIIIRGPNVSSAYLEEELAKSAWIDTGDGVGKWFVCGDLGRQDGDGYFWVVGRR